MEANKVPCDKRTTLQNAVARYLRDSINIGIGGFVNTRIPVATVHEIIRLGAQDLTLTLQSNSICCELLAGAMILKPDHLSINLIEMAWYGHEIIGDASLVRHLCSKQMIQVVDYTNQDISSRLKAGAMGIPFLPHRNYSTADFDTKMSKHGKTGKCPFTGEDIYLVRACRPDLGIVHVQAADMYGNSRIFGDLCSCADMAGASAHTIITTEQIIPDSTINKYPNLTAIHHCAVDALVDQPFGATPGDCYGHYGFDAAHINEFRDGCQEFRKTGCKVKLRAYYDKYIFNVKKFDDYLEQKPYPVLKELCQLDTNQAIIVD